jgi:hypothetical protein
MLSFLIHQKFISVWDIGELIFKLQIKIEWIFTIKKIKALNFKQKIIN